MTSLDSMAPLASRSARVAGTNLARFKPNPYAIGAVVAGAALAICAVVNHRLARKAERDNPAAGKFVYVNNVRLHYIERGISSG